MIAAAAVSLMAAACSGGGGSGVATLEDTATTQVQDASIVEAEVSQEEALLAFAACMRENGIEDFEDPDVSDVGGVRFNFRGGGEAVDIDREAMRAAMEACREHIDGLAFGPGGGDFDQTEIEDQLVAFAACMRDQGIDVADPELGGGTGSRPFSDLDFDDADVRAAMEGCQAEFGGELRLPGTGGGPPAGGDGRPGDPGA